jgi:hypothetical protein
MKSILKSVIKPTRHRLKQNARYHSSFMPLLVATLLAAASVLPACGDGEKLETAILLRTTLSEDAHHLDGQLQELAFYLAYPSADGATFRYVLDPEASGTDAALEGRSLLDRPYEILIKRDAEKTTDRIKVLVVAYVGGQRKAWGELRNPEHATFIEGSVTSRTVELHAVDQDPFPFEFGETGCIFMPNGDPLYASFDDRDCDGFTPPDDCNDENADIHPGVQEACNEIDDNCDGQTDEGVNDDVDDDDYSICDGDCNDQNPEVHPGHEELCDGIDNNCNQKCDETFDQDHDHYTSCMRTDESRTGTIIKADGTCEGSPVPEFFDCVDNPTQHPQAAFIHPGAEEECDGFDNNCNDQCDENFDWDGDGWNQCGSITPYSEGICLPEPDWQPDCSDDITADPDAAITYPGAPDEICDGVDHSCGSESGIDGTTVDCWKDTGANCFGGERMCQDTNGMGWSECINLSAESEIPAFCWKYDDCTTNTTDYVEAEQCVYENVIETGSGDCDILYLENNPLDETCAMFPHIALDLLDIGTWVNECGWFFWEPESSNQWEVFFANDPQQPTSLLQPADCNAGVFLVVKPTDLSNMDLTDTHEVVLMAYLDDSYYYYYHLTFALAAATTVECYDSNASGMNCGELY